MGDPVPRSAGVLLATAVVIVAGSLAAWFANRPPSGPATAVPGAATAPGAERAGVPPEPGPAPNPDGATAPAPGTTAAPAFDLVRVEPDGQAAVAGTAAPGARVTVLADSAPVAEVEADGQGNFVAIFKVEPGAEPRALTLRAREADGETAASTDVVMLLPPAPGGGGDAAAESGAAAPKVAATAIVREDGVDLLPPAGDPAAPRGVTLGSISYAAAGEVRLGGAGTAGATIRIYVDDRFAREVRVAGDGRWQAALGDLAEGLHRLRVDQLEPDGRVASRVETPFQRDIPPAPRPAAAGGAPAGRAPAGDGAANGVAAGASETGLEGRPALTVQPGSNLWTLARAHYGSGVEYTRIYTANRDLIRNPDLIYPGQIFRIPEKAEGAAE